MTTDEFRKVLKNPKCQDSLMELGWVPPTNIRGLTRGRVKYLITYDPGTGVITSNLSKKTLGTACGKGYTQIRLDGILYMAHRIAWLYVNGEWPSADIDHINHDRRDNRIVNLRAVSRAVNMRNQSVRKNNTSGVNGVSMHKKSGKWQASIRVDGKTIHLGIFDNLGDAIERRKAANKEFGFHENHGF